MCGIFGSINKKEFFDLYLANKTRGDFSVGIFCVKNDTFILLKKKDTLQPEDIPDGYNLYLGHTRAPTGIVTKFDFQDSHPVVYGNWVVGHNGIIHNFGELKEIYEITSSLDSFCIPFLLQGFQDNGICEVEALQKTCLLLDGIFGCFLYNTRTTNLYLVRGASLLHVSKNSSFSSVPVQEMKLLSEGVIYKLEANLKQIEVGKFKYDSPYYLEDLELI